jgi:tetratricopeptide (TPR) repeat protein
MVKLKFCLFGVLLFFVVNPSKANDSTYLFLLKQAKNYMGLNQFASAIPLLDSCIKINNKNAEVYNLRACATIYSGSVNDEKHNKAAIRFFTLAIGIDSTNNWYYNNRGWSYQMLDSYVIAMKDFKKAISFDTANAYYYGNVLRVLWLQNKNKEAYTYSDKIIALFPADGYAYYVRGQLKRDYLHKYPEGNKDIKKGKELGWQQGMRLFYDASLH